MIASPFELGADHDIMIPPVVASMEVVGVITYDGRAAALIVYTDENDPQPKAFLALTLN